jgi:PAS domain S-box-containing protein
MNFDRKTVLIVDDEPLSVDLLCNQLENEYNLMLAHSGREALEVISRITPDIILLDLLMPEIDGYEVYCTIRTRPALDGIPVLFITALCGSECEALGLEMGGNDFIHKPFDSDLVRLRIKNQLALSQQRSLLLQRSEELQELNRKLEEEVAMHRAETVRLRQMEQTLVESEERFRTLMEKIPSVAVQGYLLDGTVFFWNRASELLYGFTAEEALGSNLLDLIIPVEMRAGVAEAVCSMKASGEPIPASELLLVRKDGSRVPVFSSHALVAPVGRQAELFCLDIDLSRQKQAEEERQRLEMQYHHAQKLESLGVLAGGIAHDFNNILTVILGHCYMAREGVAMEHDDAATFRKIELAADRAAGLCRQMLTYAGKSPLVQTQVNLWLLVDDVVKMLQAALKKNVTIVLDLQRDIPEINGDSSQIQQIVMNLVINAADAIGDNNGTTRVVLSNKVIPADCTEMDMFGVGIRPGRYACLEVSDTGCGMDEETQKRIFEPFYTTKFTGRGLGMSAILGIISLHEGALQLVSTPGIGSTFTIWFPVIETSDFIKIAPPESDLKKAPHGTVLIVEDEEMLLLMSSALLEAIGFSAITAINGREALEIYRDSGSQIDLVMLDLVMPVMGGIEAYHEFRTLSTTLPIIICSGYGAETVDQLIKNDPHTIFVHKPYKPEELANVMITMIG